MARPQPGLAFSLPSDAGYIVGLVTHDVPKVGSLVWIATPTFDEEPTVEDVERIGSWRWPVLLPLEAVVGVGEALLHFPTMRSGNRESMVSVGALDRPATTFSRSTRS